MHGVAHYVFDVDIVIKSWDFYCGGFFSMRIKEDEDEKGEEKEGKKTTPNEYGWNTEYIPKKKRKRKNGKCWLSDGFFTLYHIYSYNKSN